MYVIGTRERLLQCNRVFKQFHYKNNNKKGHGAEGMKKTFNIKMKRNERKILTKKQQQPCVPSIAKSK